LGRAAARVLGGDEFVVGRDTRESGPLLQTALSVGLAAEGAAVRDLGVLPTPGVAWVSAADAVPAAVISASHNPYRDNGVKFFAAGGGKLDDSQERELEATLDRIVAQGQAGATVAALDPSAGGIFALDGAGRYADALAGLFPRGLEGLFLVLDCANGAASGCAPDVFGALGAQVRTLHCDPDGRNINAGCGSTHPDDLRRQVVADGADMGLAFDGDADRVLAVDHQGQLVDGDEIIAMLATDHHARGVLRNATVVVTVMSNLGLRQALTKTGIAWFETPVGDRSVLAALENNGWSLGGEQSGHVILRDLATTGDGVLTGLALADVVRRSGRSLAELASVMTKLPQVLRGVRVPKGFVLNGSAPWAEALAAVEESLVGMGRVLVRPSGTEPVVRVMVEAPTMVEAEAACATLCAAVEAEVARF